MDFERIRSELFDRLERGRGRIEHALAVPGGVLIRPAIALVHVRQEGEREVRVGVRIYDEVGGELVSPLAFFEDHGEAADAGPLRQRSVRAGAREGLSAGLEEKLEVAVIAHSAVEQRPVRKNLHVVEGARQIHSALVHRRRDLVANVGMYDARDRVRRLRQVLDVRGVDQRVGSVRVADFNRLLPEVEDRHRTRIVEGAAQLEGAHAAQVRNRRLTRQAVVVREWRGGRLEVNRDLAGAGTDWIRCASRTAAAAAGTGGARRAPGARVRDPCVAPGTTEVADVDRIPAGRTSHESEGKKQGAVRVHDQVLS